MRTKFKRIKKLKKLKIKNNFQIEIIFSNLKFAIKRKETKYERERNWRVDVISSRDSTDIEANERKKKGGKQICVKLERTTIHISFKKEEDIETNQMMRWKHDHDHDHQNQSHTLRRSVWRAPTTFFFYL